MATAKAVIKNLGISTKKTKIPADIVKGMNVVAALSTLKFMPKGTALHVYKAVQSAAANARGKGMDLENLFISEIKIDKAGNRIKHYHPRARGGGYYMWIRGKSHITVVVSDERVSTEVKGKGNKKNEVEVAEVKDVKNTEKKTVKKTNSKAKAVKKAK